MSRTFPAKSASFAIGALSLGAETIWIRCFTFLGQSTPKAFSIILGTYLVGIAFGAMRGSYLCRSLDRQELVSRMIMTLVAASIVLAASPILLAALLSIQNSHVPRLPEMAIALSCFLAFAIAYIFSILFPICHLLGTRVAAGKTGKSMSRVYAANVAGSVCGPLIVNFGILQISTSQTTFMLLALATAALAFAIWVIAGSNDRIRVSVLAALVITSTASIFAGQSDNWLIKSIAFTRDMPPIRRVVETRQGIVVSYADAKSGDVIYGGNVYDGRASVDARLNSNGINRVIVLGALRPQPKKVLIIGLSIGSWSYLIGGLPGIEKMDIVEINPGYLTMMQDYPHLLSALKDPRINLHIGDGRKFVRSAPEKYYDLVIMNTTFNWRAYISMLLSKEFLMLVQSRMAEGSLLAFNTTSSPDALFTAASVFPHAYLYDNFAVAADFDWRQLLAKNESIEEILRIKPGQTPLFGPEDAQIVRKILSGEHVKTMAEVKPSDRQLQIITDRNLLTEYKFGRSLRW